MAKGIDISMHNGTINFSAVKASGCNIAIIKATEGVDYVDPYLNQHYNGAKAVGMNIGFYHFMSEKTDPSQQAVDFWNAIKGKQFNIIPTLDIETNNQGRNQKQISDRCVEFLTKFKALSGYNCLIYTGGYFGRDNLDSRVKQYKGWIAHYGVNTPMQTGFSVVGHQYTEDGRINGISTRVDMNNFTDGIFIGSKNTIQETKEMKIQKMLATIGYPIGNSGIDGVIGNGTITAIKAFQKDCNLAVDGIVGANTWNKLQQEYNKKLGIKPNNKEEKKVKTLVVYYYPLDQRGAEYVADKLGCPTLLYGRNFDYSCVETIIAVGGNASNYKGIKPSKIISGNDRYDTLKAVLDYIK
ncbi:glycosyl hydrolase [Clostridium sporogenes]|jgi:GH25 family lysozyme M1 (1,4-beta-N-acetylmuramidase)|uniref:GH25 family lysozyme n=1 Tax=Clostridium sporogenes TaxID=1509 RepID=UPI0013D275BA|nr:GH25 family lysozyme [Clostridium sporogenes]NFF69474.1 glycosyl hydrolase [Clostridium sporogenes]NFG00730.1 glycosyl hydrolase [Clostridium sporogenes]NFG08300.1 glycosyl hydrolase [Clostridium sporogenes]NFG53431.1 glycosyl hydrolase [Clostridium sporogenes]NFP86255.1 glycosyl hydrolase [Clostridium sporogenes]